MELILKAIDVDGRHAWRWLLTDAAGSVLGDHTVRVDRSAWQAAGMDDLHRLVRHGSGGGPAVLDGFGEWLGREVLGEGIGRAIVAARPATVWVEAAPPVDPGPLELAHVAGVPLAARGDIALVFGAAGAGQDKRPVGTRLRMLAVFSQPTATTALALRHERFALSRLVRRLAAHERKAIDLEVLQYGATRQELINKMWLRQGPDVLHISAHGTAGGLVLESESGGRDLVGTDDLVELLRPGKNQLKLVVLSACESGAGLAEAAAWAGLAGDPDGAPSGRDLAGWGLPGTERGPVRWAGSSLADVIARELGAAVLAMRFPVSDDYAIALAREVYTGLFTFELPVAAAVARAVPAAVGMTPTLDRPAISIAVPTLHGAATAALPLVPPAAGPVLDPAQAPMAGFPAEPESFVGRTAVLISAGRALSAGSGFTTVLLDGEAGVGKTACALELAYGRHDTFAASAYWAAPPPDGFAGALLGLARSLERQLQPYGFAMAEAVESVAGLHAFLPQLTKLLADRGLLIVLDGLESLLTPEGRWRDPRWADLIGALAGHRGESRAILTSRVAPVDLQRPDVCRHRLLGLDLIESLQLMRELPGLSGLLPARAGEHRSGQAGPGGDRARCRRILDTTRGIPQLIMQAEAKLAIGVPADLWEPVAPPPDEPEPATPWMPPVEPPPAQPSTSTPPPVDPPPPANPPPFTSQPPQTSPPPFTSAPPQTSPSPQTSPPPYTSTSPQTSPPPYTSTPPQTSPPPYTSTPPYGYALPLPGEAPPMPAAPQSPAAPPAALIDAVVAARTGAITGMQVAPAARSRLERTIRNTAGVADREQTLAVGRLPVGAGLLLTDAALYWLDKDRGSVVIAVPYRAFPGRTFRSVASIAGAPPTHVDLGDGIPRSAGGAAADLMDLLSAMQAELRATS
ncbi:CHAT domain-containing protein [Dactylosporangium sp. NPDC050588]|uniref:CHAT domain-containing protein n=1 Tax=Dactylosporangium sp. NPDC050588 TaxID=3157211 RepID=UPI003400B003